MGGKAVLGDDLAAAVGEARPEGSPDAPAIEFFTDEAGSFEVYGLAPGGWDLTFSGNPAFSTSLIIPDGTDGLFDLGVLRLPARTRNASGS